MHPFSLQLNYNHSIQKNDRQLEAGYAKILAGKQRELVQKKAELESLLDEKKRVVELEMEIRRGVITVEQKRKLDIFREILMDYKDQIVELQDGIKRLKREEKILKKSKSHYIIYSDM